MPIRLIFESSNNLLFLIQRSINEIYPLMNLFFNPNLIVVARRIYEDMVVCYSS